MFVFWVGRRWNYKVVKGRGVLFSKILFFIWKGLFILGCCIYIVWVRIVLRGFSCWKVIGELNIFS